MIPLITSGRRVLASDWNTLFEELDEKLTELLGGKTFLIEGVAWPWGKRFWFHDGSPVRNVHAAYDHDPFTDAAADVALDVQLIDGTAKVIAFTEHIPEPYCTAVGIPFGGSRSFFDESLEVHKRTFSGEPHWIMELGFHRQQRFSSYGLAELICENITTLAFPSNWDRYRFFRIHNLGAASLTVTFSGGAHAVVVPAYGVKCVRRDSAAAGYLDGWNYFNRFKPGDLRCFNQPLDDTSPHGAMGANNVVNPAIVYQIIPIYQVANRPQWFSDPIDLYDITAQYGAYFA